MAHRITDLGPSRRRSFAMIKIFVWLLALAWTAWYRGWLDWFHVVGGVVFLALLVATSWTFGRIWSGQCGELEIDDQYVQDRDPILRRLVVGLGKGLSLAVVSVVLLRWLWCP